MEAFALYCCGTGATRGACGWLWTGSGEDVEAEGDVGTDPYEFREPWDLREPWENLEVPSLGACEVVETEVDAEGPAERETVLPPR